MIWYKFISIIALIFCFVTCTFHFVRLLKLGSPKEFSRIKGDISKAVRFSMTGAMNPSKKESAFLHLPTYTAGVIYHLGTFLSILLFFLILIDVPVSKPLNLFLSLFLFLTTTCGIGIFIKRVVQRKLRSLSNPDDYISNGLVTLFQLLSAIILISSDIKMLYFLGSSILLFYLPAGKLKHAVYFFAARYHLGFFYGSRDVWPPKKI